MAIEGYSQDKCNQRKRVSALRYGVNAVPMRFVRSGEAFEVLKAQGEVPNGESAVMDAINAHLPQGAEKLEAGDVYVHILEAANSNFVGDRFVFLGESTLKNIATDGQAGVAFMNAHRTGGLSSPSELPFGRTFSGAYQQGFGNDSTPMNRSLLGIYMLKGVHPNGANGPSTDDLDAGMKAGTIFDVSVGLRGGKPLCDVCGYGVNDTDEKGDYLCKHIPGTHQGMEKDEIKSQLAKGVPDGLASYTLNDARLGEVSAVHDGAVPGAGVQKVMSFAKHEDLSREEVKAMMQEAFEQYGDVLPFDVLDLATEVVQEKKELSTIDLLRKTFGNSIQFIIGGTKEEPEISLAVNENVENLETPVENKNEDTTLATKPEDIKPTAKEVRLSSLYADTQKEKAPADARIALAALHAQAQAFGIEKLVEDFVELLPAMKLSQDVIPNEQLHDVVDLGSESAATKSEAFDTFMANLNKEG